MTGDIHFRDGWAWSSGSGSCCAWLTDRCCTVRRRHKSVCLINCTKTYNLFLPEGEIRALLPSCKYQRRSRCCIAFVGPCGTSSSRGNTGRPGYHRHWMTETGPRGSWSPRIFLSSCYSSLPQQMASAANVTGSLFRRQQISRLIALLTSSSHVLFIGIQARKMHKKDQRVSDSIYHIPNHWWRLRKATDQGPILAVHHSERRPKLSCNHPNKPSALSVS